jgi:hypothetical protein
MVWDDTTGFITSVDGLRNDTAEFPSSVFGWWGNDAGVSKFY